MQAFTYTIKLNIFQSLKTNLQGNNLEKAYSNCFGGRVSDPGRLLGQERIFFHILDREFRHQVGPYITIFRMH